MIKVEVFDCKRKLELLRELMSQLGPLGKLAMVKGLSLFELADRLCTGDDLVVETEGDKALVSFALMLIGQWAADQLDDRPLEEQLQEAAAQFMPMVQLLLQASSAARAAQDAGMAIPQGLPGCQGPQGVPDPDQVDLEDMPGILGMVADDSGTPEHEG